MRSKINNQMTTKSQAISAVGDSSLVLLLLFFTAMLFVLNFAFSTLYTARFVSSEVQFSDFSTSGLELTPASCASSPSYYHTLLTPTTDGRGYITNSVTTDFGRLAPYLGIYICVTNTSNPARSYFVPANTAAEYNAFKANPPTGVIAR
jgi:hypothetical protein